MSRKLAKFRIHENKQWLILHTVSRDGAKFRWRGRSREFYIPIKQIWEVGNNRSAIARDGFSFISMNRDDDFLHINIYWLESNGHEIYGYPDQLYIKWDNFKDWFLSGEDKYNALSENPGLLPKLVFHCPGRLHEVLDNPIVKKKFTKAIIEFQNYASYDKINFYSDFMPYSFYWEGSYKDRRGMCGGLIYHMYGQDDVEKGKYSVHT
jgi:hypothetical protein